VPWRGPLAASTVAGAVSAWDSAWDINQEWKGRLPLSRILEDAVALADAGITVTAGHADAVNRFRSELETVPGFTALHFVEGEPPVHNERLVQPALAHTFRVLAKDGLDSFYRGALATQVAAELARAGVPLHAADLAGQRATVGRPLRVALPMADIYNCGPPSQGLASLLILGIFARLGVTRADAFDHVHGIVESTKLAFAVRDREIGDRQDDGSTLQRYLTESALHGAALQIERRLAAPWRGGAGGGDTVWFGVMDRQGRAVSALQGGRRSTRGRPQRARRQRSSAG